MNATLDVSVIIVTWNVSQLLSDCIESICRHSVGVSFEVIVVDNNSSDGTVEMLRQCFPNVRVIANENNVGFARANNQALPLAKGRYVFYLNPDTVLVDDALELLAEALDSYPEAGMVGPCLVNGDGTIQDSCARREPTLSVSVAEILRLASIPLCGNWLNRQITHPYDYSLAQPVEAISGAAMFARSALLSELGGFGDVFIHCGEDLDLCYRVRKAGSQIRYEPECRVVHFHGQSSCQAQGRVHVASVLSIEQYYRRCLGPSSALAYRLLVTSLEAPLHMAIGLVKLAQQREHLIDFRQRWNVASHLWRWKRLG